MSEELAFGPFRLDCRGKRLWRDDRELLLEPKALDVLVFLAQRAGQVIAREELLTALWPGTYVDDHALSVQIREIRRALGDDVRKARYVETRYRRGYCFIGNLDTPRETLLTPPSNRNVPTPHRNPETRYARSGDVNIAYQVVGDGPLDLVFIMGWISHLEYFWREPRFARFLHRLSSFSRLILFDKRGTGLSDRVPLRELPTLEQRMEDLRVVMDAAGCRSAAICGISEGGPLSVMFAATYPERVPALVMIGTYARRMRDASYPWGLTVEQRDRFLDQIREEWGGPVGIAERAPSLANDAEFRDWWACYLRMGASPGAAQALTRMNSEIDVRTILPTVRVPTLVVHRTGDNCLPIEEGRYVAKSIPGARLVELPGDDHLPFVGDQNAILDEVESFLLNVQESVEPERVLATVLAIEFDCNESAALESMLDAARGDIKRHRGAQAGSQPNGLIATFEGPSRAIQCVGTLRAHSQQRGLQLRTGMHVGECEKPEGPQARGPAVDIALQILRSARWGEVLASGTLKDLTAGSRFAFEDAGALRVEGADEEIRTFRIPIEAASAAIV